MDYLEKAFNYIRNSDNSDFEGCKPEELVQKAENFLELKFPDEYRRFLLEFGCGDVDGVEIFGIINDKFETNSVPDAIAITSKERKNVALEKNLIIIADSPEYYYALDISNTSVHVIELIPLKKASECEIVSNSFGEFLCSQFGIL
ncbi:MAG: SMI1/KNR4 family protein [Treponema sp.]|nr:SMI1/KNR4 family protein [Treponema sp.]